MVIVGRMWLRVVVSRATRKVERWRGEIMRKICLGDRDGADDCRGEVGAELLLGEETGTGTGGVEVVELHVE